MEDTKGPGGKGETLPPGIGNAIPIKLRSGDVVLVRRWSFEKSLLVVKLFEGIWSDLMSLKIDKNVDVEGVRTRIFELLGPSAMELARLTLDEKDRPKFVGDDFEDVVDVVNATLDLNLTEAVVKKLLALTGKLSRAIPGGLL